MMDKVPSRGESDNVIREFENEADVKEKWLAREEEKLQKLLAKKKVETLEELKKLNEQGLVKKAVRASKEYKKLQNYTVIEESNNPDIVSLKQRLNEEIKAITQHIIKELGNQLPSLETKVIGLKGRIKKQSPESGNNNTATGS